MAIKNVTNLDFDTIKANLKDYMRSQEEFSDYNFDASGLSVLIDLLAYNTHYNAVMAHLVANESFIDSAVKRNSVVSIAKTMGYTPRSARSSKAYVDLTITPDPTYLSNTLFISRGSLFTTSVNGRSYTFLPSTDLTIPRIIDATGAAKFVAENVQLVEGTLTQTSEIIAENTLSGPILLPNNNIDTTTIKCTVRDNVNSSVTETYVYSETILDVNSTSKVFYIEESTSGYYEVHFGDGVLGKKLSVGNIVTIQYIVCNTSAPNGAKSFRNSTNFTGANESVVGTVVAVASGGAPREDIESIRYTAPRYNAVKNRIVTKTDYETVIKAANPNIKSVTAWGGEDNDPPIYGRVFISLQPEEGFTITQDEKNTLLNEVISLKQPITMSTQFVDPEYTYVGLNISATYDPKVTTATPSALQALIVAEVEDYFSGSLSALKKNFYYSFLTNRINNVSKSIIGNNIELRIQKRLVPKLGVVARYEPKFNNKILPNSIRTNYFNAVVNNVTYATVTIIDKPNADVVAPVYSGTGILQLKDVGTGTLILENLGTIDYDTGAIDIPALTISSLLGSVETVRISATPHEGSKNISTDVLVRTTEEQEFAVIPKPARNIILALDQSASDIPNNVRPGISVTMVPRVAD
jgi:hypothetical protein